MMKHKIIKFILDFCFKIFFYKNLLDIRKKRKHLILSLQNFQYKKRMSASAAASVANVARKTTNFANQVCVLLIKSIKYYILYILR